MSFIHIEIRGGAIERIASNNMEDTVIVTWQEREPVEGSPMDEAIPLEDS